VSDREEIASLAGHTSCVNSVAFSPDGQNIVSGSRVVTNWQRCGLCRGNEVGSLVGHAASSVWLVADYVVSIAFSPDWQHIIQVVKFNQVVSVSGRR
jgi:WD40 repeat protein